MDNRVATYSRELIEPSYHSDEPELQEIEKTAVKAQLDFYTKKRDQYRAELEAI